MRSPSTVSTMRTVPCIAGCDGPMLIVISSGGSSCSVSPRSCASLRPSTSCLSDVRSRGAAMSVLLLRRALDRVDRQVVAAHQRLALLLRVVLAQRVADELLVEVDATEIGVAVEADAVHVVGLALLPVERGPQR